MINRTLGYDLVQSIRGYSNTCILFVYVKCNRARVRYVKRKLDVYINKQVAKTEGISSSEGVPNISKCILLNNADKQCSLAA